MISCIEVLFQADETRMPYAKELTAEVPLDLARAQVALRAHRLPGVDGTAHRPLGARSTARDRHSFIVQPPGRA